MLYAVSNAENSNSPAATSRAQATSSKMPFSLPSLEELFTLLPTHRQVRVLDLGAPSSATFRYLRHQKYSVRFENLNDFMASAIAEQKQWDTKNFIAALEQYLTALGDNEQFDAIFAWDLLCFLSTDQITYLAKRLAKHCHKNTLFHCVRYWQGIHPEMPSEFHIQSHNSVTSNYSEQPLRHYQKPASIYDIQKLMPNFYLARQGINHPRLHGAMTDALYYFDDSLQHQTPQKTSSQARSRQPRHTPPSPALEPQTSASQAIRHHSQALIDLFSLQRSVLGDTVQVLDTFAHRPSRLEFYQHFECEVLFANMPFLMQQDVKASTPLLPLRQQQRFDVVCLWDLLYQLTPAQAAHFLARLKPHVSEHTRFHCVHYSGAEPLKLLDTHLSNDGHHLFELTLSSHTQTPASFIQHVAELDIGIIEKSYLFAPNMHPDIQEFIVHPGVSR